MEEDISEEDTGFGVISTSLEMGSSETKDIVHTRCSDLRQTEVLDEDESRTPVIGNTIKQNQCNRRHLQVKNAGLFF